MFLYKKKEKINKFQHVCKFSWCYVNSNKETFYLNFLKLCTSLISSLPEKVTKKWIKKKSKNLQIAVGLDFLYLIWI